MSGNSPSVELSNRKDSALSSEKQGEKYYGAVTIPTDDILRGMSYEQVEEQAVLYSEKIAERYYTQIELAEAKDYDKIISSGEKIKIVGGYHPETKRIIIFAETLFTKLSPAEQTSLTQILNSIGYEKEEYIRQNVHHIHRSPRS